MHVLNSNRSICEMSDLITIILLYNNRLYGYYVCLSSLWFSKYESVDADCRTKVHYATLCFEFSLNIVQVSHFPIMQLLVKNNRNKVLVIYLSGCLSPTRYPHKRDSYM